MAILTTPIVGIGELLWDLFPDGRKVAGGAPFNFAFHCRQLGHEAVIVSRVGDDNLGRELRAEVRRLGMSDEFIQTDPDHPTGTVRVAVDEGGQPTYTITEGVAWDFIAWDEPLERLAGAASAACFGTLAQRHAVSRETIRRFVDPTHSRLSVCDLNIRPPFFSHEVVKESLEIATWLKLNEQEFEALPGLLGWTEGEPGQVPRRVEPSRHAEELITDLETEYLLALTCVTRGSRGCKIRSEMGNVDLLGKPVELVDTVGAGDAFTAALLVSILERQRPLSQAARFGLHYAGRVCEFQGGTPHIDRAEVERAAFEAPS